MLAGEAEKVTSSAIEQYDGLVASLTYRFIGRHDAEFDDLFQEGREKVFEALRKGELPSKRHIENGMRDWVRTLEYQTRYRRIQDVSYEEHQRMLLEQEETESQLEAINNGGLDYLDTSEFLHT